MWLVAYTRKGGGGGVYANFYFTSTQISVIVIEKKNIFSQHYTLVRFTKENVKGPYTKLWFSFLVIKPLWFEYMYEK